MLWGYLEIDGQYKLSILNEIKYILPRILKVLSALRLISF